MVDFKKLTKKLQEERGYCLIRDDSYATITAWRGKYNRTTPKRLVKALAEYPATPLDNGCVSVEVPKEVYEQILGELKIGRAGA